LNLLIIDDAETWLEKMRAPFNGAVSVRVARDLSEAQRLIRAESPEVIVLDAMIPDRADAAPRFNVQNVLDEIERHYGDRAGPDVILVSGNDSVADSFNEVVGWLEGGQICDVFPKSAADTGWGVFQAILKHKVNRLLKERALRLTLESALKFLNGEGIVTRAENMKSLGENLLRVSRADATVLITGESGTGKEPAARALHHNSGRAGKLVVVNCSAVPSELFESELFGSLRGAFTGAPGREGYFKAADGGTLFLDEIGEMPLGMQAKLLRVLQEKEITRVGDTKPVKVDVRVVAATNKTLEHEVKRGAFREDLYFRLAVITLKVPPLRDRPEDIELLTEHFIEKYGAESQGKERVFFGGDVKEAFQKYGWPGNVRELENAVQAIVISCAGEVTLDRLREVGTSETLRRITAGCLNPSEEDELLTQLGIPEVRGWSDFGETSTELLLKLLNSRLRRPIAERGDSDPAPHHCYKTLLYLALHPEQEIKLTTVRQITGLGEAQAIKVVRSLVNDGLVEVDRTGRAFRYKLAAPG
jgi:DNA-binding NtrC family response regulator